MPAIYRANFSTRAELDAYFTEQEISLRRSYSNQAFLLRPSNERDRRREEQALLRELNIELDNLNSARNSAQVNIQAEPQAMSGFALRYQDAIQYLHPRYHARVEPLTRVYEQPAPAMPNDGRVNPEQVNVLSNATMAMQQMSAAQIGRMFNNASSILNESLLRGSPVCEARWDDEPRMLTETEIRLKEELEKQKENERKERMGRIKSIKERLVKGTAADIKALIRCGFELETQSSNNLTANTNSINQSAYDQACIEAANNYLTDIQMVAHAISEVNLTDAISIESLRLATGRHRTDLEAFERLPVHYKETITLKLREYARTNISRNDFRINPQDLFSDLTNSGLIEVGLDGSVDGFEFRTDGPKTIAEFKAAAKEVFKLSHDINEKCSFHIHLSVDEVDHNYGSNLQLLLMEGVLRQADKVPSTVMSRWRRGFRAVSRVDYSDIGNYFKWSVSTDKYIAVSKHSDLNTWEFRCFGNVQNAKEASACLKIAINAVKYAYERQLNHQGPEIVNRDNIGAIAKKIANLTSWADVVSEQQALELNVA